MGLENISIDTRTQLGEELRYSRDRRAVQLCTAEEQPTHATQRVAFERCCNYCYAEQQMKAYNKNKQEHSASRLPYGPEPVCRNKMVQVVRSSNQAAPGTYKPPGTTTHQPYVNYGAGEPMSYYSHEGMSADIPKHSVLCLRWISGLCGQNRRSTQKEAENGCPYAHPDLSEVPPGVCPTYWFTGFCRFNRKADMQAEDAMEEETFGCHGWAHFTRVSFDVSISDSSSSDSDKDKKKSRRRPPSVCLSCHHVQREGGFPLLPGISCKMTVCEREAALALYSDYMKNNW